MKIHLVDIVAFKVLITKMRPHTHLSSGQEIFELKHQGNFLRFFYVLQRQTYHLDTYYIFKADSSA